MRVFTDILCVCSQKLRSLNNEIAKPHFSSHQSVHVGLICSAISDYNFWWGGTSDSFKEENSRDEPEWVRTGAGGNVGRWTYGWMDVRVGGHTGGWTYGWVDIRVV